MTNQIMLQFPPKRGEIFMCDFAGLEIPEMTKKRPVIILTSRAVGRDYRLVTVIPLSTTPPRKVEKWHMELDKKYLPQRHYLFKHQNWVKGDMIYNLSTERLELIRIGKDENGKRVYFKKRIPKETFEKVVACVLSGLDIKV